MSHSFVVVLVPGDTEDIEHDVSKALKPFDENTEVEAYQKGCHCVGWKALEEARDKADKLASAEVGVDDFDALRSAYWEMSEDERPEWEDHIAGYTAVYQPQLKQLVEAHNLFEKPDSSCEDCGGTGTKESTYNPMSKWDWWRIGGRWDGEIRGVEAESKDGGFNFSSNHELPKNNSIPVKDLPDDFICFAILTPDGVWHERGSMGWWGVVKDEKKKGDWSTQLHQILEANKDSLAVGCDLHI